MPLGVVVFCVDGEGQRRHGVQHRLRQRLRALRDSRAGSGAVDPLRGRQGFSELLEPRIDFFEGFRAGGK